MSDIAQLAFMVRMVFPDVSLTGSIAYGKAQKSEDYA
jgi:hypothetical protein